MQERADNTRYYLFSNEKSSEGRVLIPEIKDFDGGNGDLIRREKKRNSYSAKKASNVVAFGVAINYLKELVALYGTRPDCRFITEIKSDDKRNEQFKVISNVAVDLGSCIFKETEVEFSTIEGGLIQTIESRFKDSYDILPNESVDGTVLQGLKTVDVQLTSREIFRRSRLEVEDGEFIAAVVSGGDNLNARGIPFVVDYNSDEFNVKGSYGNKLSAVSGFYTNLSADKQENIIYDTAPRDEVLTLNGRVESRVVNASSGSMRMDIIIWRDGVNYIFDRVIPLDTCNPGILGDTCVFDFVKYELEIKEDESWTIGFLTNTDDGVHYELYNTSLIISKNDTSEITYTKGVKAFDLIERLVSITTGKENRFVSNLFGTGGLYENLIVTVGWFIRNVPEYINEGLEDERKMQFKCSLKKLYDGLNILQPLLYEVITIGEEEYFTIERKRDGFQRFESIKLGETIGGDFQYITLRDEERKVMGDNYPSSITLGSTKTGTDYAEVNNLFSTCGNATWNTINDKKDVAYSYTTDIRTGAEDVELAKQIQYPENPDLDSDYDNDLFFLDCKPVGNEFHLNKWADHFEVKPTKVYSVETNYNWLFLPLELLRGHGWQINSGLIQYPLESIVFTSSNCSSSVITKKVGETELSQDGNFPHTLLDKPFIRPMSVTAKLPLNQEIQDMLRGTTNGINNKYGVVTARVQEGHLENFVLMQVNENNPGQWELIESY